MEPVYVAAFISFMAGLLGYIIARFWIIPIRRYLSVKGHLASDIRALLDLLFDEKLQNGKSTQIQGLQVSVRRLSSDLVSIYQNDLPYWYRLNLESKKEQPLEAGKFLMRLANTRKTEHVIRQTDEIARLLRMKKIIVKNNLA
ncbi:MAG: hypothetical protein R6W88_07405 [Desulfobacterales bacterium]